MPPLAQSILILVVAYLLGSISGSLVLGRFRGVDIREHGSGSAGGTNALRTQGLKFALGVVLIDVGKGVLAAWLGRQFAPFDGAGNATLGYAATFAAMLGHVWPIWHGFRGGKGAATLLGGLLVMWPWALPVMIVVALATVLGSGYVGLATVLATLSLPLLAWWTDAGTARLVFVTAAALFMLLTHRHNLLRMHRGGEARFERARLLHRLRRGPQ
ncbi:MAG: glycerol-3-phosphate 1-O-acyltransferase PlsY [Lysobacter sp.]|nr:glycerol-3-phosphate 1-O-acyltransferase PlsY [Lysobacter sp.]